MREQLEAFFDDLRYVARTLARSRAFTATVIVTFALGIGANAAMFGIIDRVLLRGPDHVVAPDAIRRLYITSVNAVSGPQTSTGLGYVSYALLRDQAHTLERVAAYGSSRPGTLGEGTQAQTVLIANATWDFFPLIGARPAVGRFFGADEDRPPLGERVVVLGHDVWRRSFGGDSAVLGTQIKLFGVTHTIVGVAPAGLTGVELRPVDAWLPMSLIRPTTNWATAWNAQWLTVVARLKPGVSADAASEEATLIHRRNYAGRNKETGDARLSFLPISRGSSGKDPAEASVARWLAGVSLVVLLIACANVTNLLLARAARRRREIAVRLAVGISRWRLIRLLVAESSILAVVGCLGGLLLAYWGGAIIRALLLPDVAWTMSPVNSRVLVVATALTVTAGILVGLLPSLQLRRLDLTNALKAGSQQAGAHRTRLRSALLFAQCALSMVLLVGAGLFVRSLTRVRDLDLGYQPDRVLSVGLSWPQLVNPTPDQFEAERTRRRVFLDRAVEAIRVTPGVQHAAIAVGTPFGNAFGVDLWVPGYDTIPDLGTGPFISAVTHGYFEAAGMRLLGGRLFSADDRAGGQRVTVVNETMAKTLWPNQNALDKCLQIFSKEIPCTQVVGVVADARRFALRERPAMQYYVPYGQELGIGGSVLLVRPIGDARAFVPTLQRLLRDMDPNLGLIRTKLMQEDIEPLVRPWRVGAILFGVFALLALTVAAVGLYSVIAYIVTQRTQEFGVRLALGATRPRILRFVMAQGMGTVVTGLATGFGITLVAGRYIEPLLFETSAHDPAVVGVAIVALLGVALFACVIPASRATRVDPVIALRAD